MRIQFYGYEICFFRKRWWATLWQAQQALEGIDFSNSFLPRRPLTFTASWNRLANAYCSFQQVRALSSFPLVHFFYDGLASNFTILFASSSVNSKPATNVYEKKSRNLLSLSFSLSPSTQFAALQNLPSENLSRNDGSYRRVVIIIHSFRNWR